MLPVTIILLARIADFINIKTLNLGVNQFSGSLPTSLFALPHLEILNLVSNKLSGALPNEQGIPIRRTFTAYIRRKKV